MKNRVNFYVILIVVLLSTLISCKTPPNNEHVHSLIKIEAVKETCTTNGNIEYWTCSTCGKHFADESGNEQTSFDQLIIDKQAHTLTKTDAVPVTCATNGNIDYWTCSTCGKHFTDEVGENEINKEDCIIKAQHDFEEIYVCDESEHWRTCKICQDIEDKSEHEMSDPEYDDLQQVYHCTCSVCGYMIELYPEEID